MIAVGNSYCELVMEGTTALSLRVLREVERLAADRKRDLQVTGRLTLLGLSWLRGAPQQLSEHEDRLKNWPTLLLLALARADQAEPAARLWQLSLHDPLVGEMAAGSLDGWAEAAEDDGELRRAVVSFLQWIAADPAEPPHRRPPGPGVGRTERQGAEDRPVSNHPPRLKG